MDRSYVRSRSSLGIGGPRQWFRRNACKSASVVKDCCSVRFELLRHVRDRLIQNQPVGESLSRAKNQCSIGHKGTYMRKSA